MIKLTPPMGWNSWNTFGENINEKMIFETADVMAESGLRDKGYEYLVIDDCWSLRERDENGRLVPDPEKFPHGMKAVADYVHSKGLKFGMYSCAGNMTCAGYPGSYEHEFIDAETFASWDVDFLKYDYCYHSPILHGKYLYRRMGLALENCGRDILFSAEIFYTIERHIASFSCAQDGRAAVFLALPVENKPLPSIRKPPRNSIQRSFLKASA